MNSIKLVAVFIFSLGLMACGSGTGTEKLVVTPPASALTMSFTPTKAIRFDWPAATSATYYKLYEAATSGSGYALIKTTTATSFDHVIPLYARLDAKYILKSCSESACSPASIEVFTSAKIAEMISSIGYAKASNTGENDWFGRNISLSGDGNTLAVGALTEDSNATGIGGDDDNNLATDSGAVYVFSRSGTTWTQQAYVKASNTQASDGFGVSVSLSRDGNTLAVGATHEDSNAVGIGGDDDNNSISSSGATYVFSRNGTTWTQQAYVKASNTGAYDWFGGSLSLSSDGNTLAVGANFEDSNATGIGGDDNNNLATESGAVYVFSRSGTTWTQQAYVKASNTGENDWFGRNISLSGDGNTLAVGALTEDSNATGIGGDDDNNLATDSGAVYVFSRSGTTWTQQAYVKASNTQASDGFGISVSLSSDGNTLAVGADSEDSNSTVINVLGTDDGAADQSGAAYVFSRSGNTWTEQAYVKASNTGENDYFGRNISLSGDGNTLAVGANFEDSNATGIGGDDNNNLATDSGAVYVFSRSGTSWAQQAYVKASNTEVDDYFGTNVSLNSDGNTLAVGATGEDSNSKVINDVGTDTGANGSGAVYLY